MLQTILEKGFGIKPKKVQPKSNQERSNQNKDQVKHDVQHNKSSTHKAVTKKDIGDLYDTDLPSFVDLLPYAGYDSETNTFILEDFFSRAKVYTIEPIATEGRDSASLMRYRDKLCEFIENTFHEYAPSEGQWVIQQFTCDDPNIDRLADRISDYAVDHAKGSAFTERFVEDMRHHLKGIANNRDGIFVDDVVTSAPFVGSYRTTKLIVYRRCTQANANDIDFSAAEEINDCMMQGVKTLENGGYKIKEDTPREFFSWLLAWFNPQPDLDREQFYRWYEDILEREADGELPIGDALCNSLVHGYPRSDNKNNCWWFDEKPSRFIRLGGLRSVPRIGQLTGEVVDGVIGSGNETVSCSLDRLPKGSILASTTVICPQTDFEFIIQRQAEKAYGGSTSVQRKEEELSSVANSLGRGHSIVRNFSGLYVMADNLKDLKAKSVEAVSTLHNCGLKPLPDKQDPFGIKAYISALPMMFNPVFDGKFIYHKPIWAQQVANLSFVYGRDVGTGNPCLNFFNRGGSPLSIDPWSKKDRESNTFGLVLGAPGSGKSATATYLAQSLMAVYRPKMFIFDPGNSFGLTGDYFERYGISVARMSYSAKKVTPIALFADAAKLVDINEDKINDVVDLKQEFDKLDDEIADAMLSPEEDDDAEVERDILGELELIALLMITGGEKREYDMYRRADRQMLRQAIVDAAKDCVSKNVMVRPEHIMNVLQAISDGKQGSYNAERRSKAADMAGGFGFWCQEGSFENEVFNTEANGIPDADCVIIDMATFTREGYEAHMCIAFMGIMQYINNIAERDQHLARLLSLLIDEAHLVTINPLLAPFLIKMVKMFRKLGVSPWLITQNVTDFPEESEKLLSMIEWYIVMLASETEIERIANYKRLSVEQKNMMLSTRKSDRQYTEGVILSNRHRCLFRAVPPSRSLTMAMTDKEEKAERQKECLELKSMNKPHKPLDGAIYQAEKLDVLRGISA
ncbi:TPA: conjugative transfer ATPase [Photobacterium damselae]